MRALRSWPLRVGEAKREELSAVRLSYDLAASQGRYRSRSRSYEKLRDYCLNPDHPRGKHKARVFRETLGYCQEDAEELRGKIKELLSFSSFELGRVDQYGQRYRVEMEFEREGKEAVVLTAWILKKEDEAPRLTTCYVK